MKALSVALSVLLAVAWTAAAEGALQSKMPPAAKSIGPVGGGFLGVSPETYHQDFAADLPKSVAHFMSISQVPIAANSDPVGRKFTAAL